MIADLPPLLRYFGGKYRDAAKIISHFPPHSAYCEPFCGGASVLLQKPPVPVEIINDLSDDVVNFFQVFRDRYQEFLWQIENTPYSRTVWKKAFEPTTEPLQRAVNFYIRSWQTHGGGTSVTKNGGWSLIHQSNSRNVVETWNRTNHLEQVRDRLKLVQIECGDALKLIRRVGENPDLLLYCDPPYIADSRVSKNIYDHEMSIHQHQELLSTLQSVDAMVILSGYGSEVYERSLSDWRCIKWDAKTNGSRTGVECLWLSPNCKENYPLLGLLA